MKQTTSTDKAATQTRSISQSDSSVGQNAVAIAPPDYGIDFIDSDQAVAVPLQRSSGPLIQAKLKIGPPDDKYEQEADRIAEQVMSMPDPAAQRQAVKEEEEEKPVQAKPLAGQITPLIQRQPEEEEEELLQTKSIAGRITPFIQRQPEEEKEKSLQPKTVRGQNLEVTPNLEGHIQSLKSSGQPLPTSIRNFFEPRFGHNFDAVRTHTDSQSAKIARSLSAKAFTVGGDIVLGNGQYAQDTTSGKRLLAHELTHVVQQRGVTKHIQRVLGPPYPFQGIIITRWNAAFRRTPSRGSGIIANLDRNTRVTAIGNTGNWLEVRATIDGVVETGFVSQELVGNIPAVGFAPAVTAGGRTEVTDFGTYNVYPNVQRGPLQPNELFEAEFQRLQRAWTRVNDNSGGLITNGNAADVASMRRMLGRYMGRSQTFRNLILEITEDAANPVTINVGRNNSYWLDEFATNRVDLRDLAYLEENPRPGYEWAFTQGEDIVHWLAERRHDAVQGGGFGPAHAAPMAPGGLQEQYRADIGQTGRIVSQVGTIPAVGLLDGVFTDDSGNILRQRLDVSGGDAVPYEIRYEPVGGGAVDTRRNNIVADVRSTSADIETLYLKFTNAAHDVTSPDVGVSFGSALNFRTPFGGIVPAGASVDVELYEKHFWIADTLLGTIPWAHPFESNTTVFTVGGVDYTVTVRLEMEP